MREESIRKALEKDIEERQKAAAVQMEEEYMKDRERHINEYVNLWTDCLKNAQSCSLVWEKTMNQPRAGLNIYV